MLANGGLGASAPVGDIGGAHLLAMALAFYSLLFALSWGDLSLVVPASASLTFVANAFSAKLFLHERVGKRRLLAALLVMSQLAASPCLSNGAFGADPPAAVKPRLLVLTDIGGDPDDSQSMIRLMVYANEFELEALIASASCAACTASSSCTACSATMNAPAPPNVVTVVRFGRPKR